MGGGEVSGRILLQCKLTFKSYHDNLNVVLGTDYSRPSNQVTP